MSLLGIDVSKDTLDLALQPDDRKRPHEREVRNDASGVARLQAWVKERGCELSELTVVMEATGVYHERVAQTLYEAGCKVIVANPKRVRDYAAGLGLLHKTDKVDARALVRYGKEMGSELVSWSPPPEEVRILRALYDRLSAVQEDLQRELNRRDQAAVSLEPALIINSLDTSIARLRLECERLKHAIEDHFDQHPGLKAQRELLQSIPSIGPVSGDLLLCLLLAHRFGSARQAAAFCGLIPRTHQSGTSVRKPARLTKQGDAELRAKLYMAAVVATRHNSELRQIYQALLAAGKSKMSALGALMRRLLHIAYGVLKHQAPYNSKLVRPSA